jgi:hypothetical protein
VDVNAYAPLVASARSPSSTFSTTST